jgi:hypothetical protein
LVPRGCRALGKRPERYRDGREGGASWHTIGSWGVPAIVEKEHW